MRSNQIRQALLNIAEVDTVVIHSGESHAIEKTWDERRTRKISVRHSGFGPRSWLGRLQSRKWIAAIADDGEYDAIIARYCDVALLVPPRWRNRIILDADDFIRVLSYGFHHSISAKFKAGLRNTLSRFIVNRVRHAWYVSCSPVQRLHIKQCSFLPNVVTVSATAPGRQRQLPPRILMVGSFDHEPNVEGLRWFYREVWPLLVEANLNCEIHAVGASSEKLATQFPSLTGHGFVDNIATNYSSASVVIAPILSGSGTQIKVIDALAHACPVIVSPFAFSGFQGTFEDGKHLLLANAPNEWLAKIQYLMEHPAEAHRIGISGHGVVKAKFGLEQMEVVIRATLDEMCGRGLPPSAI